MIESNGRRSQRCAVFVALMTAAFVTVALLTGCSPEKGAWEKASAADDIAAYEAFLVSYPDGEHAAAASARITALAYEQAEAAGTVAALEAFVEKYPDGEFVERARSGVMTLRFEAARDADTAEAYDEFLALHPTGSLADDARARLDEIRPPFTREEALEIDAVSPVTGRGTLRVEPGDEPGTFSLTATGKLPGVANLKDACFVCLDTIRLAPNVRVPTAVFAARSDQDWTVLSTSVITRHTEFKDGRVVKHTIEVAPLAVTLDVDHDSGACIVSGPEGAVLKKKGAGFLLVEGAAHLSRRG